jgi:hypothetical protein
LIATGNSFLSGPLAQLNLDEWWWAAVVVILFLRWVWENLTQKKQEEEIDEEYEDLEPVDPYAPPPPQQPQSAGGPGGELRRFLQELAGGPAEAPPQPPPPPPVARAPVKKAAVPKLSKEEQAALERIKQRKAQAGKRTPKPQPQPGTFSLRDALRNPASLRTAIVLKEILDKPKALQED